MVVIISIDPGYVNLGFCVLDTSSGKMFAERASLLETKNGKRYKFEENIVVHLCAEFINDRSQFFEIADIITIEQQMVRKFLIIQYCLMSLLFVRKPVMAVSPRSVRAYFDISKKHI